MSYNLVLLATITFLQPPFVCQPGFLELLLSGMCVCVLCVSVPEGY